MTMKRSLGESLLRAATSTTIGRKISHVGACAWFSFQQRPFSLYFPCAFSGQLLDTSKPRKQKRCSASSIVSATNQDSNDGGDSSEQMTQETRQLADLLVASANRRRSMRREAAVPQTQDSAACTGNEKRLQDNSATKEGNETSFQSFAKERKALAHAITLLESRAPAKQAQADALLLHLQRQALRDPSPLPFVRIGIAGAPGAGKSTLVEAFGTYLLSLASADDSTHHKHDKMGSNSSSNRSGEKQENISNEGSAREQSTEDSHLSSFLPHSLAVVCVDPSSIVTGGSILGDKTRMTQLSAAPDRVYIRPAPSLQNLGGLGAGERTNDVIDLLTKHAGYDTLFVETVGLGQSEVDVSQCVDVTVLLIPPGGGDALQGAKKGLLEVADVICVTKADGDLQSAAQTTAADYQGSLQLARRTSHGLRPSGGVAPTVLLTSSKTGLGMDRLWLCILRVFQQRVNSGELGSRRRQQQEFWTRKTFWNLVRQRVEEELDGDLSGKLPDDLPPRVAASRLMQQLSTLDRHQPWKSDNGNR